MMAAVYSFVVALPPRSPVIVFPSAIVCESVPSMPRWLHRTIVTYIKSGLLDLRRMLVQAHVSETKHGGSARQPAAPR